MSENDGTNGPGAPGGDGSTGDRISRQPTQSLRVERGGAAGGVDKQDRNADKPAHQSPEALAASIDSRVGRLGGDDDSSRPEDELSPAERLNRYIDTEIQRRVDEKLADVPVTEKLKRLAKLPKTRKAEEEQAREAMIADEREKFIGLARGLLPQEKIVTLAGIARAFEFTFQEQDPAKIRWNYLDKPIDRRMPEANRAAIAADRERAIDLLDTAVALGVGRKEPEAPKPEQPSNPREWAASMSEQAVAGSIDTLVRDHFSAEQKALFDRAHFGNLVDGALLLADLQANNPYGAEWYPLLLARQQELTKTQHDPDLDRALAFTALRRELVNRRQGNAATAAAHVLEGDATALSALRSMGLSDRELALVDNLTRRYDGEPQAGIDHKRVSAIVSILSGAESRTQTIPGSGVVRTAILQRLTGFPEAINTVKGLALKDEEIQLAHAVVPEDDFFADRDLGIRLRADQQRRKEAFADEIDKIPGVSDLRKRLFSNPELTEGQTESDAARAKRELSELLGPDRTSTYQELFNMGLPQNFSQREQLLREASMFSQRFGNRSEVAGHGITRESAVIEEALVHGTPEAMAAMERLIGSGSYLHNEALRLHRDLDAATGKEFPGQIRKARRSGGSSDRPGPPLPPGGEDEPPRDREEDNEAVKALVKDLDTAKKILALAESIRSTGHSGEIYAAAEGNAQAEADLRIFLHGEDLERFNEILPVTRKYSDVPLRASQIAAFYKQVSFEHQPALMEDVEKLIAGDVYAIHRIKERGVRFPVSLDVNALAAEIPPAPPPRKRPDRSEPAGPPPPDVPPGDESAEGENEFPPGYFNGVLAQLQASIENINDSDQKLQASRIYRNYLLGDYPASGLAEFLTSEENSVLVSLLPSTLSYQGRTAEQAQMPQRQAAQHEASVQRLLADLVSTQQLQTQGRLRQAIGEARTAESSGAPLTTDQQTAHEAIYAEIIAPLGPSATEAFTAYTRKNLGLPPLSEERGAEAITDEQIAQLQADLTLASSIIDLKAKLRPEDLQEVFVILREGTDARERINHLLRNTYTSITELVPADTSNLNVDRLEAIVGLGSWKEDDETINSWPKSPSGGIRPPSNSATNGFNNLLRGRLGGIGILRNYITTHRDLGQSPDQDLALLDQLEPILIAASKKGSRSPDKASSAPSDKPPGSPPGGGKPPESGASETKNGDETERARQEVYGRLGITTELQRRLFSAVLVGGNNSVRNILVDELLPPGVGRSSDQFVQITDSLTAEMQTIPRQENEQPSDDPAVQLERDRQVFAPLLRLAFKDTYFGGEPYEISAQLADLDTALDLNADTEVRYEAYKKLWDTNANFIAEDAMPRIMPDFAQRVQDELDAQAAPGPGDPPPPDGPPPTGPGEGESGDEDDPVEQERNAAYRRLGITKDMELEKRLFDVLVQGERNNLRSELATRLNAGNVDDAWTEKRKAIRDEADGAPKRENEKPSDDPAVQLERDRALYLPLLREYTQATTPAQMDAINNNLAIAMNESAPPEQRAQAEYELWKQVNVDMGDACLGRILPGSYERYKARLEQGSGQDTGSETRLFSADVENYLQEKITEARARATATAEAANANPDNTKTAETARLAQTELVSLEKTVDPTEPPDYRTLSATLYVRGAINAISTEIKDAEGDTATIERLQPELDRLNTILTSLGNVKATREPVRPGAAGPGGPPPPPDNPSGPPPPDGPPPGPPIGESDPENEYNAIHAALEDDQKELLDRVKAGTDITAEPLLIASLESTFRNTLLWRYRAYVKQVRPNQDPDLNRAGAMLALDASFAATGNTEARDLLHALRNGSPTARAQLFQIRSYRTEHSLMNQIQPSLPRSTTNLSEEGRFEDVNLTRANAIAEFSMNLAGNQPGTRALIACLNRDQQGYAELNRLLDETPDQALAQRGRDLLATFAPRETGLGAGPAGPPPPPGNGEGEGGKERRAVGPAERWAQVITTEGGGYILGKLKDEWFDDPPDPHASIEFRHRGFLGKAAKNDRHFDNSRVEYIFQGAARANAQNGYTEISNVLIQQPPEQDSGMPQDQEFDKFRYVMWSKLNDHADSRNIRAPLQFVFYLPRSSRDQFWQDLNQDPDLLEKMYQRCYPEATSRGMHRVTAHGLKVARIDNDLAQDQRYDIYNYVATLPMRPFSHPIGEGSNPAEYEALPEKIQPKSPPTEAGTSDSVMGVEEEEPARNGDHLPPPPGDGPPPPPDGGTSPENGDSVERGRQELYARLGIETEIGRRLFDAIVITRSDLLARDLAESLLPTDADYEQLADKRDALLSESDIPLQQRRENERPSDDPTIQLARDREVLVPLLQLSFAELWDPEHNQENLTTALDAKADPEERFEAYISLFRSNNTLIGDIAIPRILPDLYQRSENEGLYSQLYEAFDDEQRGLLERVTGRRDLQAEPLLIARTQDPELRANYERYAALVRPNQDPDLNRAGAIIALRASFEEASNTEALALLQALQNGDASAREQLGAMVEGQDRENSLFNQIAPDLPLTRANAIVEFGSSLSATNQRGMRLLIATVNGDQDASAELSRLVDASGPRLAPKGRALLAAITQSTASVDSTTTGPEAPADEPDGETDRPTLSPSAQAYLDRIKDEALDDLDQAEAAAGEGNDTPQVLEARSIAGDIQEARDAVALGNDYAATTTVLEKRRSELELALKVEQDDENLRDPDEIEALGDEIRSVNEVLAEIAALKAPAADTDGAGSRPPEPPPPPPGDGAGAAGNQGENGDGLEITGLPEDVATYIRTRLTQAQATLGAATDPQSPEARAAQVTIDILQKAANPKTDHLLRLSHVFLSARGDVAALDSEIHDAWRANDTARVTNLETEKAGLEKIIESVKREQTAARTKDNETAEEAVLREQLGRVNNINRLYEAIYKRPGDNTAITEQLNRLMLGYADAEKHVRESGLTREELALLNSILDRMPHTATGGFNFSQEGLILNLGQELRIYAARGNTHAADAVTDYERMLSEEDPSVIPSLRAKIKSANLPRELSTLNSISPETNTGSQTPLPADIKAFIDERIVATQADMAKEIPGSNEAKDMQKIIDVLQTGLSTAEAGDTTIVRNILQRITDKISDEVQRARDAGNTPAPEAVAKLAELQGFLTTLAPLPTPPQGGANRPASGGPGGPPNPDGRRAPEATPSTDAVKYADIRIAAERRGETFEDAVERSYSDGTFRLEDWPSRMTYILANIKPGGRIYTSLSEDDRRRADVAIAEQRALAQGPETTDPRTWNNNSRQRWWADFQNNDLFWNARREALLHKRQVDRIPARPDAAPANPKAPEPNTEIPPVVAQGIAERIARVRAEVIRERTAAGTLDSLEDDIDNRDAHSLNEEILADWMDMQEEAEKGAEKAAKRLQSTLSVREEALQELQDDVTSSGTPSDEIAPLLAHIDDLRRLQSQLPTVPEKTPTPLPASVEDYLVYKIEVAQDLVERNRQAQENGKTGPTDDTFIYSNGTQVSAGRIREIFEAAGRDEQKFNEALRAEGIQTDNIVTRAEKDLAAWLAIQADAERGNVQPLRLRLDADIHEVRERLKGRMDPAERRRLSAELDQLLHVMEDLGEPPAGHTPKGKKPQGGAIRRWLRKGLSEDEKQQHRVEFLNKVRDRAREKWMGSENKTGKLATLNLFISGAYSAALGTRARRNTTYGLVAAAALTIIGTRVLGLIDLDGDSSVLPPADPGTTPTPEAPTPTPEPEPEPGQDTGDTSETTTVPPEPGQDTEDADDSDGGDPGRGNVDSEGNVITGNTETEETDADTGDPGRGNVDSEGNAITGNADTDESNADTGELGRGNVDSEGNVITDNADTEETGESGGGDPGRGNVDSEGNVITGNTDTDESNADTGDLGRGNVDSEGNVITDTSETGETGASDEGGSGRGNVDSEGNVITGNDDTGETGDSEGGPVTGYEGLEDTTENTLDTETGQAEFPQDFPPEFQEEFTNFSYDAISGDTRWGIVTDFIEQNQDSIGGNWENPENGITKADVLADMWTSFQARRGMDPDMLQIGETFNFSDWNNLTADEQRVFTDALTSTTAEQYITEVMPDFQEVMNSPLPDGADQLETQNGGSSETPAEHVLTADERNISVSIPGGGEYPLEIPEGTTVGDLQNNLQAIIDDHSAILEKPPYNLPPTIADYIVSSTLDHGLQAQGIDIDVPKPAVDSATLLQELNSIPQFEALMNQPFHHDGGALWTTVENIVAPADAFRGWENEKGYTSFAQILTDMIIDNSEANGFDIHNVPAGDYTLTQLGVRPDQLSEFIIRTFAQESASDYARNVMADYIAAKRTW